MRSPWWPAGQASAAILASPRQAAAPGAIAQLGERLDRTQEVAGSSPASSISESPAIGRLFRPGDPPQPGSNRPQNPSGAHWCPLDSCFSSKAGVSQLAPGLLLSRESRSEGALAPENGERRADLRRAVPGRGVDRPRVEHVVAGVQGVVGEGAGESERMLARRKLSVEGVRDLRPRWVRPARSVADREVNEGGGAKPEAHLGAEGPALR